MKTAGNRSIDLLRSLGVSLLLIAAATALRVWPLDMLGDRFIWSSFYPAVVLAALFGGIVSGTFAMLLSCIIVFYGWHYFSGRNFSDDNAGWVGMLVFILNGILISVVAEILRRTKNKILRAKKELEERNAQINAISDNLPDSFIYQATTGKDKTPKIIYVSNGVEKFIEKKAEEIVQNPDLLYQFIWEEDREMFIKARNKAAQKFFTLNIDVRFYKPDGECGWANIHSKPRLKEDGIYIWDGLFTDITYRVLLEKELNRQQLRSQQLLMEMSIQEHEHEKNVVAYELHEQINQLLIAAKIQLDLVKSKKELAENTIPDSIDCIRSAIEKINLLFESIDAPSFGDLDLSDRIEALATEMMIKKNHLVILDFDHAVLNDCPDKLKLLLYRIIKNRLNYIRDNPEPCKTLISISTSNNFLHLSVFYPDHYYPADPDSWSIDLRRIQNRVEFYGGSTTIALSDQGICEMKVTLPMTITEVV
jgi:signal transduction histidine kinase